MIPMKLIYRTYLNPIWLKSSSKTNGSTQQNGTMHLFRGKWVYLLFIALKRLKAF